MDYFDLHCDTALAILDRNERLEDASGTISLEKAAALHRYAQVYALFIDDKLRGEAAWRQYRRERDYLLRQVKRCSHQIAVCTDAPMLCATLNSGKRAILLSIEGGAAFGGKLERVAEAANDGVRLLTLTWFGENELGYGSGVGGHFKPFGYEVLKECRRCGIVPDISHLSDEGVYDVFSADS
ncbi:MAG: membrane dipeptidase, partial [Pygmaiobacter sp.]